MKLYCEYDHAKKEIADHKCDNCGKLLCKICGYTDNSNRDYCNECWQIWENKITPEDIKNEPLSHD